MQIGADLAANQDKNEIWEAKWPNYRLMEKYHETV